MIVSLLIEQLQTFLTNEGFLRHSQETHFVVAYSGGADSTALLATLAQLKQEKHPAIRITAAYYWHAWRNALEDLEAVQKNCQQLNIPWVVMTPNLNTPKTEAAARDDRYNQLAHLAQDIRASAILTAHHQDDQVETLLFRLLRGTGLDGIKGIQPVRYHGIDEHTSIPIVRPFLDMPQTTLAETLKQTNLSVAKDPTNDDSAYKRNFIRNELLPVIEKGFPNARGALLQFSHLALGELDILETKLEEVWQDIYTPEDNSLNQLRLNQLSSPMQARLLRRFLQHHQLDCGHKKIADVMAFLSGINRRLTPSSLHSLTHNTFLCLYQNRITIEHHTPAEVGPVSVPIPSHLCSRDLRVALKIEPFPSDLFFSHKDFASLPENQILVDLTQFKTKDLTLRTRHQGDRIRMLGMEKPMRLKRLLINRKIPRFKRDAVPILASDSEVLWVYGIGVSESIRVKKRPTHRITLTQIP